MLSLRTAVRAAMVAAALAVSLSGCVFLPALGEPLAGDPSQREQQPEAAAQQHEEAEATTAQQSGAAVEAPEEADAASAARDADLGQETAVQAAEFYLRFMGFSRQGLIDQLEWEGYPPDEVEHAVDSLAADWDAQAVIVAENYVEIMTLSRQELYDRLIFEGFTPEQAEYGVAAVGH